MFPFVVLPTLFVSLIVSNIVHMPCVCVLECAISRSFSDWLFQVRHLYSVYANRHWILLSGSVWERVNGDTKAQLLCEWVFCIISATQWRQWVTTADQPVKRSHSSVFSHIHTPTWANFKLHPDTISNILWIYLLQACEQTFFSISVRWHLSASTAHQQ